MNPNSPLEPRPAVVRTVDNVEQTTGQIRAAWMEADEAMRRGLNFCRQVGAMLARVRDAMERGRFIPWIERSFPFSVRTAQRLMHLSDNWEKIPQDARTSFHAALAYLTRSTAEAEAAPEVQTVEPASAEATALSHSQKPDERENKKGGRKSKSCEQLSLELDPAAKRERDAREQIKAWRESVQSMIEGLEELLASPAGFDVLDELRRTQFRIEELKKESYNVHAGVGHLPTVTTVHTWPAIGELKSLLERLETMNYTRGVT